MRKTILIILLLVFVTPVGAINFENDWKVMTEGSMTFIVAPDDAYTFFRQTSQAVPRDQAVREMTMRLGDEKTRKMLAFPKLITKSELGDTFLNRAGYYFTDNAVVTRSGSLYILDATGNGEIFDIKKHPELSLPLSEFSSANVEQILSSDIKKYSNSNKLCKIYQDYFLLRDGIVIFVGGPRSSPVAVQLMSKSSTYWNSLDTINLQRYALPGEVQQEFIMNYQIDSARPTDLFLSVTDKDGHKHAAEYFGDGAFLKLSEGIVVFSKTGTEWSVVNSAQKLVGVMQSAGYEVLLSTVKIESQPIEQNTVFVKQSKLREDIFTTFSGHTLQLLDGENYKIILPFEFDGFSTSNYNISEGSVEFKRNGQTNVLPEIDRGIFYDSKGIYYALESNILVEKNPIDSVLLYSTYMELIDKNPPTIKLLDGSLMRAEYLNKPTDPRLLYVLRDDNYNYWIRTSETHVRRLDPSYDQYKVLMASIMNKYLYTGIVDGEETAFDYDRVNFDENGPYAITDGKRINLDETDLDNEGSRVLDEFENDQGQTVKTVYINGKVMHMLFLGTGSSSDSQATESVTGHATEHSPDGKGWGGGFELYISSEVKKSDASNGEVGILNTQGAEGSQDGSPSLSPYSEGFWTDPANQDLLDTMEADGDFEDFTDDNGGFEGISHTDPVTLNNNKVTKKSKAEKKADRKEANAKIRAAVGGVYATYMTMQSGVQAGLGVSWLAKSVGVKMDGWDWSKPIVNSFAQFSDLGELAANTFCKDSAPTTDSPSAVILSGGGMLAAHLEGLTVDMTGRYVECMSDNATCAYFDQKAYCGDQGLCKSGNKIYKAKEVYHIITFMLDPSTILANDKKELKFHLIWDGSDVEGNIIDINKDEEGGKHIVLAKSDGSWGATDQMPLIRKTPQAHKSVCIVFEEPNSLSPTFWSNLRSFNAKSSRHRDNYMLCHLFTSHNQDVNFDKVSGWAELFSLGMANGGWGSSKEGTSSSGDTQGGEVEGLPTIIN